MSTRLQVVLSESELAEIRASAERRRMNVSEWVRAVLREERARERTGRADALREPIARYGGSADAPSPRVRLELDLRQELLAAVRARYHLPTNRAAVEFALRRLAVVPMSRDEALAMEGAGWDGDLDALRRGDPGATW